MRFSTKTIAVALAAAAFAAPALAQDFDLMGMADTNTDGKVSLDEFTAFQKQGFQFASQGADKVKVADVQDMMKPLFAGVKLDADGNATPAAFDAVLPDRFKGADKNGDGALSKDELMAMFGPPPAQ